MTNWMYAMNEIENGGWDFDESFIDMENDLTDLYYEDEDLDCEEEDE